MTSEVKQPPKRIRVQKSLPAALAAITDQDRNKFTIALEVDNLPKSPNYGQEFNVVQGIKLLDDNGCKYVFDLNNLALDQTRQLCRNVGVTNCGSMSKYHCRQAIARFFEYQDKLETNGIAPTTHASRLTSTICCAINVVFSEAFFEDFKSVNDQKDRVDHEAKTTYMQFWICAAAAHNNIPDEVGNVGLQSDDDSSCNDAPDEFCVLLYTQKDVHMIDAPCKLQPNLCQVDQFDPDALRKKITTLFKV